MLRLKNFPFRDPRRAERELRTLKTRLRPEAYTPLDRLLAASPATEQALYALTRLGEQHPTVLGRAADSAAGLQALVAVASQSRFLSQSLLLHPEWIDELLNISALERSLTEEELRARLMWVLSDGV